MGTSDQPRARSSDNADLTPARIIVADDDRISREALAAMLRNAGHLVETAVDGQEAVDRAAHGNFDLVLLDLVMPRLSGLEACRILKSMTADGFLPVVLVTVKTDTQSRVEGLRLGADDYVCKPFDEQELLARITSMLRIKRLHDQMALQKTRFERLTVHDELTGLYNTRYLHTRLGEEWKRAERYHEPFACLMIDVDQLRAVNETLGRKDGDLALKRVADCIRRSVREVDVLARYGGDEFIVVLPSTHFAGSVVVAERIWREVLGRPIELEGLEPRAALESEAPPASVRSEGSAAWALGPRDLSVSIGVALYPSRDVRNKDALLRAADAALGQAKREGGNRICVFQQQGYIFTPTVSQAPRDAASYGPPGRTRHPSSDSLRPPSLEPLDPTPRKGS